MAAKMGAPSQMPPIPNREDIGATWTYLQAGIARVMNELEQGIDMQMYMGVYTAVHNFCTSQKAVGVNSPTMHQNHRGGEYKQPVVHSWMIYLTLDSASSW
jgi:cullin 1